MADPAARPVLALVTCEHASNRVPARWRRCFEGARGVLATHRGHDRGAAAVARLVARGFRLPVHLGELTRLVVDLNRSPGHPRLFSRYTRVLPAAEREAILASCYDPWRDAVVARIRRRMAARAPVLHLSVHSFAPVLRGHIRRTDLGILYDPSRPLERAFARRWREALREEAPGFVVRRNHPYRGTDDGFMTALRRSFPAHAYAGLELEISQKHLRGGAAARRIARLVRGSLSRALDDGSPATR